LPGGGELARQGVRGVVAALERPVAVARDEGQRRDVGPLDDLEDELGGRHGKPAKAPFLPGGDEAAHRDVVLDRRPGGREGEPPAGALAASADRPRSRRAAAVAERRLDSRKARPAAATELAAGEGADRASLRQQQVEHEVYRTGAARTGVCRFRLESAPPRGVEQNNPCRDRDVEAVGGPVHRDRHDLRSRGEPPLGDAVALAADDERDAVHSVAVPVGP
jgi:hypothetical protein